MSYPADDYESEVIWSRACAELRDRGRALWMLGPAGRRCPGLSGSTRGPRPAPAGLPACAFLMPLPPAAPGSWSARLGPPMSCVRSPGSLLFQIRERRLVIGFCVSNCTPISYGLGSVLSGPADSRSLLCFALLYCSRNALLSLFILPFLTGVWVPQRTRRCLIHLCILRT